jgi:hypothetical protein
MDKKVFDSIINELQTEAVSMEFPEGYCVKIYTSQKPYEVETSHINMYPTHITLDCIENNQGGYLTAFIPYKEIKLIEF